MPLTIFILNNCPYCIYAKIHLTKLLKDPKYQNININYINEKTNKELSNQYNYYYVPSFYYNKQKLYEGAINKTRLKQLLDTYLNITNQ